MGSMDSMNNMDNMNNMDSMDNIDNRENEKAIRKAKAKRKYIIENAKCEHKCNIEIEKINAVASQKGLYIPILTKNNGECLFESICYHLYDSEKNPLSDTNIEKLRMATAYGMLLYKNKKIFLPNQELTMEKLFYLSNEIQVVYCRLSKSKYVYNFDSMCIDISQGNSWDRINTEIMLMFMSFMFDLKFTIFHGNGHITNVDMTKDVEQIKTVYLGLIDEYHYIPLATKPNPEIDYGCLKYNKYLEKLKTLSK